MQLLSEIICVLYATLQSHKQQQNNNSFNGPLSWTTQESW